MSLPGVSGGCTLYCWLNEYLKELKLTSQQHEGGSKKALTFREKNAVLFDKYLAKLFMKIRRNSGLLGVLGVGAIVIVGGIFGFQSYRSNAIEKRQVELAKILSTFFDAKEKNQEKITTLDNEMSGLVEKEKDEVKRKLKKAELEKSKAELKTSFSIVAEPLKMFVEKNPSTVEAALAESLLAEIATESGNLGDARILLDAVVKNAKKLGGEALATKALMSLIQIDVTEKKYAEATSRIDEVIKTATKGMVPALLLQKAQVQFLAGEQENVQKTYDELQKSHADSAETKQARVLLSLKADQ